jgi:UDP-N-acetylmuramyl pentapeptide phosphotransferase/UDP-N-acetylglucosamine-1-phosphate transferase
MWELSITEWVALAFALLGSFTVCGLIVLTQGWHGAISLDHDTSGDQKFHDVPVPRIGGVGIFAGIALAALSVAAASNHKDAHHALILLACGLPAFLAGLLEDMTKRVSVSARLMATFVSAALAAWQLNARLIGVDTPGLDALLALSPMLAFVFTCFAVGGVANAVNIIDGFNGLAGTTCVLMLAGLGALAHGVGDALVLKLCLMGIAAFLGFLCLNFPFGKLFLGDGGAYMAGFWVAECGVLLLSRNPEVSTWAVLLCCVYPVWETIFSMWRKSVVRKTGMGKPDKLHFHMLVYRRWTRRVIPQGAPIWLRHMLTTLAIATLGVCVQAFAWLASVSTGSHGAFMAGICLFAFTYVMIYRDLTIRVDEITEDTDAPLRSAN